MGYRKNDGIFVPSPKETAHRSKKGSMKDSVRLKSCYRHSATPRSTSTLDNKVHPYWSVLGALHIFFSLNPLAIPVRALLSPYIWAVRDFGKLNDFLQSTQLGYIMPDSQSILWHQDLSKTEMNSQVRKYCFLKTWIVQRMNEQVHPFHLLHKVWRNFTELYRNTDMQKCQFI